MDPAELSRYIPFDLEPSVEDWLKWAKGPGKIGKIMRDFIMQHPKHLEHSGEYEPQQSIPRSKKLETSIGLSE